MRISVQVLLWIGLAVLLSVLGYTMYTVATRLPERSYSTFLSDLEQGEITTVSLKAGKITGTDHNGSQFTTFSPDVPALLPLLKRQDVEIITQSVTEMSELIRDLMIVVLLLGGWFILSRKKSSKSFEGARYKRYHNDPQHNTRVTFADVAGVTEAQEEVEEIIDFLKDPHKHSKLGGRIPKGVLLQGPPGTGKTLLAKAIAGEASVPFYPMGGSDFVEMFAGLGASRVRELFREAKKYAPCIIFIDEIDAIGGTRTGSSNTGTNDEREQTLNALLVEMDGFSSDETVIVIAATNRPDILDAALLRPGRFDRQITLTLPDIKERLKILEVHTKKVAMSNTIDLSIIARSIPGFSGADIANLVNEAALRAAKTEKNEIELNDFENAKDKIIMGLERKNAVISEKSRRLAAYHEAGHAAVAKILPETDPIHRITIIPRGRALGLTQQLPLDDQFAFSQDYLLNRIKILMGGRLTEELIFNQRTTGASNDLLVATDIACRLVCEFGMSETLGPVTYAKYLTEDHAAAPRPKRSVSEQTLREIDTEVKRIIAECCSDTNSLLKRHNVFLHMIAEALLVNETLDGDELDIVYRCYTQNSQYEKATSHTNRTLRGKEQ